MTALKIFANTAEQAAFLAQQSAHIGPRVPAENGGNSLLAQASRYIGTYLASAIQNRQVSILDVRVLQAQMLIQSGTMKPNKALETMIKKHLGESHDESLAVYFAYQVLSGLEVFTDEYKQELLDTVKKAHPVTAVNHSAASVAVASAAAAVVALQPRATSAGAGAEAVTPTIRPVSALDCRLEKAVATDKQAIRDIVTAYEASLRPTRGVNFLNSDVKPVPIEDKDLEYPADSALGIYKITHDTRIIGFFIIDFNDEYTTDTKAVLELATCLHPDYHGKGIVTHMKPQLLAQNLPRLGTLIQYKGKSLPVKKLISQVDIRNTASLLVNFKIPALTLDDIVIGSIENTGEIVMAAKFRLTPPAPHSYPAIPLPINDGSETYFTLTASHHLLRLQNRATRPDAIAKLAALHTQLQQAASVGNSTEIECTIS